MLKTRRTVSYGDETFDKLFAEPAGRELGSGKKAVGRENFFPALQLLNSIFRDRIPDRKFCRPRAHFPDRELIFPTECSRSGRGREAPAPEAA